MKVSVWIMHKSTMDINDGSIIGTIQSVLMTLFYFREESFEYLYKYRDEETKSDFESFMIDGLTVIKVGSIRDAFFNMLNFICANFTQLDNVELPVMVVTRIMHEKFVGVYNGTTTRLYHSKVFFTLFAYVLFSYFK